MSKIEAANQWNEEGQVKSEMGIPAIWTSII